MPKMTIPTSFETPYAPCSHPFTRAYSGPRASTPYPIDVSRNADAPTDSAGLDPQPRGLY